MRLSELRSNAALNKKESNLEILEKHYRVYGDKLFIHFGKTNKIGINPRYNYDFTPAGIYAYPAAEVISHFKNKYTPYGGEVGYYKFLTMLTPSDNARVLNIGKASQSTLDNLIRLTYNLYKKTLKIDDPSSKPFTGFDAMTTWKKIRDMFIDINQHSNKAFTWNSFIRKLGYNVIIDSESIITDDINAQAIFLSIDACHIVDQIHYSPTS